MASPSSEWNPARAIEHYGIHDWGAGYFGVNDRGEITVADPSHGQGAAVALRDVIAGLSARGLDMPVLLRIDNLLDDRIRKINEAFATAISACNYNNVYRGVFPIKVNQQRHVIEEIAQAGAPWGHGFEAGSKAELIIALASLQNQDSVIVCNGYKDAEFIQLGLYACQLGIACFFVVENPSEIPIILEQSEILGVRPRIGVRVKLSTRVDGHWSEDSGDRSIFGLSTTQLIDVIDRLKAADRLDCLELLHVHIGSQIPNIQNVRQGVQEACRFYTDLAREGAPLGHLDLGGGLAVDYDGSQTNWTHSMNYRLEEYCADILDIVTATLDAQEIPHPVLITESGRATVAYSSVLLFNVLDVSHFDAETIAAVGAGADPFGENGSDVGNDSDEPQALVDLMQVFREIRASNLQESLNDAVYYRDRVREEYRRGAISLRTMARADNLYKAAVQKVISLLPEARRVPQELQNLGERQADIYYGNFSVFQSLPDTWAIEQVFPVVPVHRLDEKPERLAVIADLTCDSDGRIDLFAHPEGQRKSLALHALREDEEYYLGVFLVGAYQETLGDLHNLFGDTHVASIRLDGEGGFDIETEIHGDSIADVLSYVEYNPALLTEQLRRMAERAVRNGTLTVAQRQAMLKACNESLGGYTYYER